MNHLIRSQYKTNCTTLTAKLRAWDCVHAAAM